MIEVRKITAPEAYKIRKDVLREAIPLTEKMDGDFDDETLHLGAYVAGELGCVATFMQHDSAHFSKRQYRLRGMATAKKHQHQGLGKKVLEQACVLLKKQQVDVLWCNARVLAIPFYKNCGFKVIGTEFDVHLIGPHYVMYKFLKDV